MWHDRNRRRRGHALITKELGEKIPPLYANDGAENPDEVKAVVKLFSIISHWTWYITEWDANSGVCFGLVDGFESELGYFDLTELSEVVVAGTVPVVERDLHWDPTPLGEIRAAIAAI
ncbi:MAG: DUF2958 domain-containing protein [Chloroflexi bacterium]|nr:DUF2958 domain-containing protein [Chloroflexota bacterium]